MEKKFKVYTQASWGAEKFYIQDHEEHDIVFEADSVEDAIQQAHDYIMENRLCDVETTEGWIQRQNWFAEEVDEA